MRPPEEFFDDYARVRTHFEWARHSVTGERADIPQSKLVVEEWQEFLAKWQSRIRDPELTEGLQELAALMERIAVVLERAYLEQLQTVLQARREWFIAEQLLKGSVIYSQIVKQCPPELLPELKKIYQRQMGEEYDATKDYLEAEADAEAREAEFLKELAGLEINWPERADAALRQRLLQVDGSSLNAWDQELTEAINQ